MAQESPHAKAQYTEAQARKLLEQLQCYSAAKGFSQGRMASMLDISSSSLSNLMHGGYAGNEDAHLAKIEQRVSLGLCLLLEVDPLRSLAGLGISPDGFWLDASQVGYGHA